MSKTAKQGQITRAMLETDLRRNRALGGGLSKAIDHVMTERQELADALQELQQWCYNNVPYFPQGEAAEMSREHTELLAKVRGEA